MGAPIDGKTGVAKVRLYVSADLFDGAKIQLAAGQSHYLRNVMRRRIGDRVLLFNGRDGEWRAQISDLNKSACVVATQEQTRVQLSPADIWLLFAPVKKARIDFIAQKATEMGVRTIWPVITNRTSVARVNLDRLKANAIEAAEQCDAVDVPEIRPPQSLDHVLKTWDPDRRIMYCDEARSAPAVSEVLPTVGGGPWAVLIGPEGGFSADERQMLTETSFAHPVSLGPRILRADTAVVSALTIWHAQLGDWKTPGRGFD